MALPPSPGAKTSATYGIPTVRSPGMHAPCRARSTSSAAKVGATAAPRLGTTSSPLASISERRRPMRSESGPQTQPVSATASTTTEIVRPASEGATPKSAARSGSTAWLAYIVASMPAAPSISPLIPLTRAGAVCAVTSCRPVVAPAASAQPEVGLADPRVIEQRGAVRVRDDAAVLQYVAARRGLQRRVDVLLDQQHGGAGVGHAHQPLEDLLDELGCEPERELVDHDQLRVGHQTARDRAHLLLPARHAAGHLVEALAEAREQPDGAVDVRLAAAGIGADAQVLADGEAREEAPALGDVRHPRAHDLLGGTALKRVTVELHLAARGGD